MLLSVAGFASSRVKPLVDAADKRRGSNQPTTPPTSSYITASASFSREPIDNASMEEYLGEINGKASRARARILNQNGIETRYYAIDKRQQTVCSRTPKWLRAR